VFLRDSLVVEQIIQNAHLSPQEIVLEIGPGRGALTAAIARQAATVYALEIDRHYVDLLQQRFAAASHVHILQADARRYDYTQLPAGLVVLANLPYSTGTHILRRLFAFRSRLSRLVVMLQKEVAARVVAVPGSRAYGGLSIFFQYYAAVARCFDVSRHAFTPQPAVDSTVIALEPYRILPCESSDEAFLFRLVKSVFMHRRKTLRKNLLTTPGLLLSKDDLVETFGAMELGLNVRPQELSVEQFVQLAAHLQRFFRREDAT
jgi:16S rRNA (adenine1518-N6/adenine1519-N6)-dimethyltransferase